MILRDLTDAAGWIKRIIFRLDRLEGGAPLENASVTNGLLRFIGGTLRVDSGGRVEIVGTLQIDGTTSVTGQFNVEGPWNLTGNGEISGNVRITGKVTQVGDMDVDGKFTLRGDNWSITGNGQITGNVSLKGTMKVDGGRIEVGEMLISEAQGGSIEAPFQIVLKSSIVEVQSGIHVEQGAVFDGGITAPSLIPISYTAAGKSADFIDTIVVDSQGRFRIITG